MYIFNKTVKTKQIKKQVNVMKIGKYLKTRVTTSKIIQMLLIQEIWMNLSRIIFHFFIGRPAE